MLKLFNLNTSANIGAQSINITIKNLLNPSFVVNITYFKVFTYYSNENDLVAIANYNGFISLQPAKIQLNTLSSTASTTYTFTNITISLLNNNIIPLQGYLIVTLPSEIRLLDVCNSFLSFTN